MKTYELHEVDFSSSTDWDTAMSVFELWDLYHLGAWLDFIEQTQSGRRKIYGIYEGDSVIGYLPGFVIRKGPVRIFGSPFPGWTTSYMGPIVNRDVDMKKLFRTVSATLRKHGFLHSEIRHKAITADLATDIGLHKRTTTTYIAEICSGPEEILSSFSQSRRKVVRRALRSDLEAAFVTDPTFLDIHYEQLRATFAKRGIEPTYPKQRISVLWDLLMPSGRMLATVVMKGQQCIASRIDLIGNGWLHSFSAASSQQPEHLRLYRNDLATYHVMCEAAKRGITKLDMTGGGRYKRQFNARLVDIPTFVIGSPMTRFARSLCEKAHRWKMRLRGTSVHGECAQ